MKVSIPSQVIDRILTRHAHGEAPGRIAQQLSLKRSSILRVLRGQRHHERVMSGELIGKDAQTRIARTPCHLTPLASKRDAKGKIDWPGVHGWVDVREEVRAVMETMRQEKAA